MTVRLNVMLVQSPGMSGLQSEINAELTIQLMGIPGIDVAIVNSFQPDTASGTDRLLLTATQNDMAIIDWREPGEVLRDLEQLGVAGQRAPHRLDPSVPPIAAGLRRLYLIDLRRGDRPASVVDALRALLQDRRVVAVTLGAPGVAPRASGAKPLSPLAPPVAAEAVGAAAAEGTPSATEERPCAPSTGSAPQPRRLSGTARWPSDNDLDALVDGVNGSDW